MLKISQLGFISLFGSILLLLFQAISSLANKNFIWEKLRLVDILDSKLYSWTGGITFFYFNHFVDYILNLQLFIFLFVMAILFFLFDMQHI